ncbi:response regulator [Roseateles sp. NT4]|uniref:response regulator n=1 Tax=Roseateles sp. NT4 TaxID=3453715 RepID=UPI003EEA152E
MPTPARRPVLYVEDHPVNALLMAAILERRPELELVIAANGEEAMCLAAGLRPTLLLLDLGLPDCHGSRLLGLLRALPGCESAPAVAVTADTQFPVADWGFCDLWPKPLDVDEVLNRLDMLAGTHPSPAPPLPELRGPSMPAALAPLGR